MPHELGKLPLTYYQTLIDHFREEAASSQTRNGDDDENEGVVSVDVDSLIRKGQTTGFGVEQ